MTHAQIIKALAGLTSAELADVEERARMLRKSGIADAAPMARASERLELDGDARWVLGCVIETFKLANQDIEHEAALRRSKGYDAFAEKVSTLMVFLRKASSSKAVRRGILMTALRLQYESLTRDMMHMSARDMISVVHRVPAVLDAHYPGYAEAGFLHLLVRSERGKGKWIK